MLIVSQNENYMVEITGHIIWADQYGGISIGHKTESGAMKPFMLGCYGTEIKAKEVLRRIGCAYENGKKVWYMPKLGG